MTEATTSEIAVTVRYFAAARAAAGIETETLRLRAGHDGRRRWSTHSRPATTSWRRCWQRCSYLCDGVAVRDPDVALRPARRSMCLPPFAGG